MYKRSNEKKKIFNPKFCLLQNIQKVIQLFYYYRSQNGNLIMNVLYNVTVRYVCARYLGCDIFVLSSENGGVTLQRESRRIIHIIWISNRYLIGHLISISDVCVFGSCWNPKFLISNRNFGFWPSMRPEYVPGIQ